ncbi:EscU/YscU/HrcU family type III secretion system export apparatus switch protein [Rhizosaccharibacter radicis]|uniref:Flagellar type III secretion system protein FlhB n=1 Tax=Rhizosaccharibacter radicis TaxID=2782605 RepID=A0ABT1VZD3_9PROT|nr:flagellar type III secretion system protein FlhB [Acetobacteraceae bacterium KSS12]
MADTDKEDRTEAPSARRLEKAREDGQVAMSRELQTASGLGAGLLVLATMAPSEGAHFVGRMRGLMERSGSIDLSGARGLRLWGEGVTAALHLCLPVILAAVAGIVAATLLQTGFLLRPAALMPSLNRLNPANGLKRVLGGETAAETVKALVKLMAFAAIGSHLLTQLWPLLRRASGWDVVRLEREAAAAVLHGMLMLLAVQGVIALADVAWVRHKHMQKLRMSRQEVRDEHKESEGDPHFKAKLRQLRRQRAKQRRMLEAVSTATVVVTNPTHYAVALAYQGGDKAAPRIVAKGVDAVAARIREAAQDAKVPLVSNPPLARALYKLPLESEVPREHFQVVAGIIAYVWRLRRPAPGPPPVR